MGNEFEKGCAKIVRTILIYFKIGARVSALSGNSSEILLSKCLLETGFIVNRINKWVGVAQPPLHPAGGYGMDCTQLHTLRP